MRLVRFRVTNFRSVADSGWIDTDSVTALIGTNESGKTNLLLPLWKLNPAKEGGIVPLSDLPRKDYNVLRNASPSPIFVEAEFAADSELLAALARATNSPIQALGRVLVARRFDGSYRVTFPDAAPALTVPVAEVSGPLGRARGAAEAVEGSDEQAGARASVIASIAAAEGLLDGIESANAELVAKIAGIVKSGAPQDASYQPVVQTLQGELTALTRKLGNPHPDTLVAAHNLVQSALPRFVYYSNYGNLDSEIYLPHVIENLKREGLGAKEEAKARTLKVLFEFVGLKAEEILTLGQETAEAQRNGRRLTDEEIGAAAQRKKERSVLLQSAGTQLTRDFKAWWNQGDYRFRLEADGSHFRIWVADERRPEEIELEGRSTGLQWFLSFYLIFLVESRDAHSNAILLLDEPGLSLHPMAQRDLSSFFTNLSAKNQLLYTTHSPFLIDADRLDRVRKVYVGADGATVASADLGASSGDRYGRGSGYAVHAALGLTVAESLLIGCKPVLVEGPSDQHYLTAIKTVLTKLRQYNPSVELVFPPCGGVRGVKPVVAVLSGRDDQLPIILLDGDKSGRDMAESLRKELYSSCPDRILDVAAVTGIPDAEIEDLIPQGILVHEVERLFRSNTRDFSEVVRPGEPVVRQIEAWAKSEGISLPPGWKVDLARRVKQTMLAKTDESWPEVAIWRSLFEKLG